MGYVRKIRRAAAILLTVCMTLTGITPVSAAETASDMRLTRTEGTVLVTNRNGKEVGVKADMKLFHGYRIKTEDISYAWMSLDTSKMAKLDCKSDAEVHQKGKNLEILLNSGNLFFNVTEKLAEDESLNIRTSTMLTGIRGTAGWAKILDQWHSRIYILEGTVECSVTDPVSGQLKTAAVHSGEYADVYVYDEPKKNEKCDIIIKRLREEDVPGFVAVELYGDKKLCDRIKGASGLDTDRIVAGAHDRLRKDEDALRQQLKDKQTEEDKQKNAGKIKPMYAMKEENDDGSSGGGGGGYVKPSRPTPPAEEETTTAAETTSAETTAPETTAPEKPSDEISLMMPVSAQEVNDYFKTYKKAVLIPNPDPQYNHFYVADATGHPLEGQTLTVPAGKSLVVSDGIDTTVLPGYVLQIDGTMDSKNDLINQGTVNNTSTNTLLVGTKLNNMGRFTNTGRVVADEIWCSADGQMVGVLDNTSTGRLEAKTHIYINGGRLLENGTMITPVLTGSGGSVDLNGSGDQLPKLDLADGEITIRQGSYPDVTVKDSKTEIIGGAFDTVIVKNEKASTAENTKNLTFKGGEISKGILVEYPSGVGDLAENGPLLIVEGGTIHAGPASGAITVNCPKDMDPTLQPDVVIRGGSIDSIDAGKSAIDIQSGVVDIHSVDDKGNPTGLALCADSVDKLFTINDQGNDVSFARWYHLDGKNGVSSIAVGSKSLLTCREEKGNLQLTNAADGLVSGARALKGGEKLILSRDMSPKEEPGTEAHVVEMGDTSDTAEPAVLDLNGHTLTGFEFDIKASSNVEIHGSDQEKSGTILFTDTKCISSSGKLVLRGGTYKNTAGNKVLHVMDNAEVTLTEGSTLLNEAKQGDKATGTVIENNGHLVIGEADTGKVTVTSLVSIGSNSMIVSEPENGGSEAAVFVENAEIKTGEGTENPALQIKKTRLVMGEKALISSTSKYGTLRVISKYNDPEDKPQLELNGGAIVNEGSAMTRSTGTPTAIWWNARWSDSTDVKNVSGLLPPDMQTEIKSKYSKPIVFAGNIDSEGTGIDNAYTYPWKNDGYECKGPKDGYYYITEYIAPATGSNAIRRAMAASEAATASNADKDQNKEHAPAVSATASNAEKNTGVNQSSSEAAGTSKEETKKPKLPVASAANAEKKEEGGKLPLKDTRPDPESSRSTENKRTEAIPAAAAAKSDSTGDGNGDGNADNGIKAGRKEEE